MLKKIIKAILAIVKQLAIAFFFASIIIFIASLFVKDKLELGFSLISNFAVAGEYGEQVEVKFDEMEKRLVNYPHYGTKFATLIIPDMGDFAEEVVHGDDLDIIKKNVGHFAGSYFPGEGGSIIFAAHNSRKHFMFLPKVKIGSIVTVKTDYGVFNYKVYKTKIIKDTQEEELPIQKEKEILMMYTCYPTTTVGHKDKRYVVYAELDSVEYTGDKNES